MNAAFTDQHIDFLIVAPCSFLIGPQKSTRLPEWPTRFNYFNSVFNIFRGKYHNVDIHQSAFLLLWWIDINQSRLTFPFWHRAHFSRVPSMRTHAQLRSAVTMTLSIFPRRLLSDIFISKLTVLIECVSLKHGRVRTPCFFFFFADPVETKQRLTFCFLRLIKSLLGVTDRGNFFVSSCTSVWRNRTTPDEKEVRFTVVGQKLRCRASFIYELYNYFK